MPHVMPNVMPDVMPSTKTLMRLQQPEPAGRGAWAATAVLRRRFPTSAMRFRVVSTRLLPSNASDDG